MDIVRVQGVIAYTGDKGAGGDGYSQGAGSDSVHGGIRGRG